MLRHFLGDPCFCGLVPERDPSRKPALSRDILLNLCVFWRILWWNQVKYQFGMVRSWSLVGESVPFVGQVLRYHFQLEESAVWLVEISSWLLNTRNSRSGWSRDGPRVSLQNPASCCIDGSLVLSFTSSLGSSNLNSGFGHRLTKMKWAMHHYEKVL